MSLSRAIKLLETAGRDSTPDNERLSAITIFYKLAEQKGGIEQLLNARVELVQQYVPYSEQKREIARLEGKVEELSRELRSSRAEVAQYVNLLDKRDREIETLKARAGLRKVSGSSMPYLEFAQEARSRLVNADRNWQMMFEEQTGLKRSRFARFCQIGKVDSPEYIRGLERLHPCDPPAARGAKWTVSEVQRVRDLSLKGETEKNIAKILSKEFGRRVTENMIKRLKHNSRNGQGVFRDASYGPPIGSAR